MIFPCLGRFLFRVTLPFLSSSPLVGGYELPHSMSHPPYTHFSPLRTLAEFLLFSEFTALIHEERSMFASAQEYTVYGPGWACIPHHTYLIQSNELNDWLRPSYTHQHKCCLRWKCLYSSLIRFAGNRRVRGICAMIISNALEPFPHRTATRRTPMSSIEVLVSQARLGRYPVCSKQRVMVIHIPTVTYDELIAQISSSTNLLPQQRLDLAKHERQK